MNKDKEEKIILDTDQDSASFQKVEGWVSRDGRFYGKDERLARFAGSTHKKCDCGEIVPHRSYCHNCYELKRLETYKSFELVEWDKKTPFCLLDDDQFFFEYEEYTDYIYNNELEGEDLNLVLCKPVRFRCIDEEYFLDDMHEDAELPDSIVEKINEVNRLIQGESSNIWVQSNKRVNIEITE